MSGNERTVSGEPVPDPANEQFPEHDDDSRPYLVLWGDAVAPKELGRSLLLAVPVALAAFLLAQQVLSGAGNEQVVDGYALLVGLAACVATGALCAKLFTPKRVFAESRSDGIRSGLPPEFSTPEAVSGLPDEYIEEMREIGLYEPGTSPAGDTARKGVQQ